jgi:type IV secretory pathway TrbF-like protein
MTNFTASIDAKDKTLTRAAQRYLEQYGDPLVMNTYLKVTILILGLVCAGLIAALVMQQKAAANVRPIYIRINEMGRAEAVDYNALAYKPQEIENRYYLSQWAQLYYSRNRFSIQKDFTNSLYFLSSDLQRSVMDHYREAKVIPDFVADSTAANVDVEVKNVSIEDLRQSPYKAQIEFVKIFTNPADHREIKRERWTAHVVYEFHDHVANEMLLVNPLGTTITYFREDQAFE